MSKHRGGGLNGRGDLLPKIRRRNQIPRSSQRDGGLDIPPRSLVYLVGGRRRVESPYASLETRLWSLLNALRTEGKRDSAFDEGFASDTRHRAVRGRLQQLHCQHRTTRNLRQCTNSTLTGSRTAMVSLTFDEFHAIRSRQRAAAEAEASASDSAKASTDTPVYSTKPTAAAATTEAAAKRRSSTQARGASISSPSAAASPPMSRSRSGGASDDGVAPTSGSVSGTLGSWFRTDASFNHVRDILQHPMVVFFYEHIEKYSLEHGTTDTVFRRGLDI